MNEPKQVWSNSYMSLFSDGTIDISDGVGDAGELDKDEVMELRDALNRWFRSEPKSTKGEPNNE